jgi:hypothetical protein
VIEDLERFMAELASADDAESFARRWEPAPAPFAAVEVSSWEEYVSGGAEVVFADDAKPTLAQLEAVFGPFTEGLRAFPARRVLRGAWWREGMPIRIVLLIYSPPEGDEPLDRLVLQRGIAPEE